MVEGRCVGHQSRTGSLLVMTSTGVIRAKAFNRMQEGERWTSEGLEDLKGVPWQMVPPAAGSTAPAPAAGSPAPARAPPLAAGAEAAADAARPAPAPHPVAAGGGGGVGGVPGPRKLYILKRDIEACGPTPNCMA
eukprot:3102508-Pyramimonas_sp.AAC.1